MKSKKKKLVVIAGPCVLEGLKETERIAETLMEITEGLPVDLYFKASFDKANRTSGASYRGPGIKKGIEMLRKIKSKYGIKTTTDIHLPEQADMVRDAVDMIQIPAFLCRQTDLLIAAGKTKRSVNVKKGQFLSPAETKNIIEKLKHTPASGIMITERGTTFGYNRLVVDMTGIPVMRSFGVPVIIDATHSVQQPGGGGTKTTGNRDFAPVIARAGIAAGADGIFMEVHPQPDRSPSDAANIVSLREFPKILKILLEIFRLLD